MNIKNTVVTFSALRPGRFLAASTHNSASPTTLTYTSPPKVNGRKPSKSPNIYLLTTKSAPAEFVVKGALLALFIPGEWAIDNGDPNTYSDYQIFRDAAGYWNALEIEPPMLVGNLPDYD
jgi:hypothetical protein